MPARTTAASQSSFWGLLHSLRQIQGDICEVLQPRQAFCQVPLEPTHRRLEDTILTGRNRYRRVWLWRPSLRPLPCGGRGTDGLSGPASGRRIRRLGRLDASLHRRGVRVTQEPVGLALLERYRPCDLDLGGDARLLVHTGADQVEVVLGRQVVDRQRVRPGIELRDLRAALRERDREAWTICSDKLGQRRLPWSDSQQAERQDGERETDA